MAKMRFNYRSQTLSQNVDITIICPTNDYSFYDQSKRVIEGIPGGLKKFIYQPDMKYQTVYMLHGGGDDDTILYRKTNVERYAEENQVMLVTPNLPNSFYVDTAYGIEYSTFLTEELRIVVQSLFPSSPKREDNFIVGYAMGGNGALITALTRPDLYSVCVDISGGMMHNTDIEDLKEAVASKRWLLYASSFGDPDSLEGSKYDYAAVAKKNIKAGIEVPKFMFFAGSDEGKLRERVHNDYKNLSSFGYDATYEEVEGYGHAWPLWDQLLDKVFSEKLPIKREPVFPAEGRSE